MNSVAAVPPAQAQRIDGKAAAEALRMRVGQEAAAFAAATGRAPGLSVVLVGDDPASAVYVGAKGRATEAAGMAGTIHRLPADTAQAALMARIDTLNADPATDGILVQLPLPRHIDAAAVLTAIDPAKDVDGFHPLNVGALATGAAALVPCTPLGARMLIRQVLAEQGRASAGLHAIIIGRSNIVGKPMAQLLLADDMTVTIAHSRTRDLAALVRTADVVVAAVGRAHMVRGDWIKPGAIVIDVGINRLEPDQDHPRGRLVGDVAFDEVQGVAGAITPVPGGVGPMTIACLLANTVTAARARAGLPPADGLT